MHLMPNSPHRTFGLSNVENPEALNTLQRVERMIRSANNNGALSSRYIPVRFQEYRTVTNSRGYEQTEMKKVDLKKRHLNGHERHAFHKPPKDTVRCVDLDISDLINQE